MARIFFFALIAGFCNLSAGRPVACDVMERHVVEYLTQQERFSKLVKKQQKIEDLEECQYLLDEITAISSQIEHDMAICCQLYGSYAWWLQLREQFDNCYEEIESRKMVLTWQQGNEQINDG